MPVETTAIQGVYVVRWERHEDERGFFRQTYQFGELSAALGRDLRMRQGNHSRSHAGVLRGFHVEPWDKLIYVPRGLATCVVADVRPESPTFAHTLQFLLGDDPGSLDRVFISRGLANAFYSHRTTDYLNDVSEEFDPAHRHGVAWNDPHLAVAWPHAAPVLSAVDAGHPTLKQLFPTHPGLA